MLIPERLEPGDLIGVVTPSYPTPSFHPERLQRGIAALEEEFELKVKLGDALAKRTGHLAGSHEERASDINHFLADPEVRAIWCASGGFNANALLPLLDYRPIHKDPKVVIGYSDATALLLGLHAQSGLVTFHGPTVCRELGGFVPPFPYTLESCRRALFDRKPLGKLLPPDQWTLDDPADLESEGRGPLMLPATPWRWIKPGSAEGPLLGGNLQTLLCLHGTPFWPSFKGAVFFWEEVDIHIAQVHRHLSACRQIGLFDEISGMVVGENKLKELESELSLEEVLLDVTEGCRFPILADVDCGHTDPMLTLPIGVRARLDSKEDLFALVEAATRS